MQQKSFIYFEETDTIYTTMNNTNIPHNEYNAMDIGKFFMALLVIAIHVHPFEYFPKDTLFYLCSSIFLFIHRISSGKEMRLG